MTNFAQIYKQGIATDVLDDDHYVVITCASVRQRKYSIRCRLYACGCVGLFAPYLEHK